LLFYFYLSIYFGSTGVWTQAFTLSHSASPFWWRMFWDRVSQTIYPGWLWTSILRSSWSAS
jgi:hypothetical protein